MAGKGTVMWRRKELGGAVGPFYALSSGIATISQAPCVRRFFFLLPLTSCAEKTPISNFWACDIALEAEFGDLVGWIADGGAWGWAR